MHRSLPLAAALALALSGCPRHVERDAGPEPDPDSGYDPARGNRFEGPIAFDDQRVRDLDPSRLPAGATPCREPILARVVRITDGDTVRFNSDSPLLDDRPVRIIGVDTPEVGRAGAPSECYADEASAFTAQLDGRLVWLTFDNTCFDSFDRYLAYVHIGPGEGDLWERQLLRRGLATEFAVGDNRAYEPTFVADEASAASAGAGLWSACP